MTVYIDVLLALNLYINYFLIRGTALILHRDITVRRILAAAAMGSMFSLTILLPSLPFLLTMLIKSFSCICIALVAFGYHRLRDFIIDMLCFLVVSFMYAGLMLALWQFVAPMSMLYRNGTAYFDIPIIVVALLTAAAYAVIRFLRYLSDKRSICTKTQKIIIHHNGQEITLTAIPDTGNSLTDPFSGTPVVICSAASIDPIMPANVRTYLSGELSELHSIRLAPCRTVGGTALLPLFRAEKLLINGKAADAMIGVCRHDIGAECIFNPELIII